MKPLLALAALLLIASTVHAQQFRGYDNRGNRWGGYSSPYETVIVDPYGYRQVWQPYYTNRYWQPTTIYVNPHYGVWQTPNPWYNYGW